MKNQMLRGDLDHPKTLLPCLNCQRTCDPCNRSVFLLLGRWLFHVDNRGCLWASPGRCTASSASWGPPVVVPRDQGRFLSLASLICWSA